MANAAFTHAFKGANPFKVVRSLLLEGGIVTATMDGNATLTRQSAQVMSLDPGGSSRTITLPAEESSKGIFFAFHNAASDAGELITINDDAAAVVVRVPVGGWAIVGSTGSAWQVQAQSQSDAMVTAVVAVTGGTGGSADGTITVDLSRADESTVLGRPVQVMVRVGAAQYAPNQTPVSTVTFSAATKGSIVDSGNGWALVETDADGEFDATISDSADETVYTWIESANKMSDPTDGCVVLGSNSDAGTWSA